MPEMQQKGCCCVHSSPLPLLMHSQSCPVEERVPNRLGWLCRHGLLWQRVLLGTCGKLGWTPSTHCFWQTSTTPPHFWYVQLTATSFSSTHWGCIVEAVLHRQASLFRASSEHMVESSKLAEWAWCESEAVFLQPHSSTQLCFSKHVTHVNATARASEACLGNICEGNDAGRRRRRRSFRARSTSCCIPCPATHQTSASLPASELRVVHAPVPSAAAAACAPLPQTHVFDRCGTQRLPRACTAMAADESSSDLGALASHTGRKT